MRNIKFINDYYCGRHETFNTVDWEQFPYWDKSNNFYQSQFKYIDAYHDTINKPPKSFDNRLAFLRNKGKSISSYEYLRKPKEYKNDFILYEVCVYSSCSNALGNNDDFLLDKIPHKIIEAIKRNTNLFLLINYTSEPITTEDALNNIYEWIRRNKLPFLQIILTSANYNVFDWYSNLRMKYKMTDAFSVIPHLWSLPLFANDLQNGGFNNQQLNKEYVIKNKHDEYELKKYNFNCLMRNLRPARLKLLLDFKKLDLLDTNQISYNIEDENGLNVTDYDYRCFLEQVVPNKIDEYWNILKKLKVSKPKQVIDYDDLSKVKGIGMETDIPYKDSMFTVVSESFFFKPDHMGYISEKVFKPIIHKHPFIVFGSKGTLAYLQDWGFRTLAETGFVDESYDSEPDHIKRYQMVMEQILFLCNLDEEKKFEFMFNAKKVVNHNFMHLKTFSISNYNESFMGYLDLLRNRKEKKPLTLF